MEPDTLREMEGLDVYSELASINPMYETTTMANKNARHAICQYRKDGRRHIDIFLLDYSNPIPVEMEKLRRAGTGRIFENIFFMCWMGVQPG